MGVLWPRQGGEPDGTCEGLLHGRGSLPCSSRLLQVRHYGKRGFSVNRENRLTGEHRLLVGWRGRAQSYGLCGPDGEIGGLVALGVGALALTAP